MFELFIANKNYSSWSLRPWLLLTQLQIPFEERQVIFGSEEWFDYREQFRTVPCLRDGDVVLWDSLAIVEYVAERNPQVWPQDHAARAWARSAAAEMHSSFQALRNGCPMSCGIRAVLHGISPALQSDISRVDGLWQEGLNRFGGPFLAGGEFTTVDAFFAPVAYRVRSYGLELSNDAMEYGQRLIELGAMQAWEQAGLAEDVREIGHEEEIAALADVVEDHRVRAAQILRQ